jgi:hypothetical protein
MLEAMPRWQPLHPAFERAIRDEALKASYAELWRRLIPIANAVGEPRPSYWIVRRRALEERRRRLADGRLAEELVADILVGRYPRALSRVMQHKL